MLHPTYYAWLHPKLNACPSLAETRFSYRRWTMVVGKTLSLLTECKIRFSVRFLPILSFPYLLIYNPNRYGFFGEVIDRDSNYISIFFFLNFTSTQNKISMSKVRLPFLDNSRVSAFRSRFRPNFFTVPMESCF